MRIDGAKGITVFGQHGFFLLRFQLLWPPYLTWNFYIVPGNFVHISGTSDTWNCISSVLYCLAYLHIVLISRNFPNRSFPYRLPPYLLLCLPFYSTVHSWVEAVCGMPIVLLFHLVHFFLFICCACLAAGEFCSYCTILRSKRFHSFYLCFHTFHTTIYGLLFKICCKPITV